MIDFLLSFIRSSLDLFSIDLFCYVFFSFLGVFVICLIRFVVWGK